MRYIPHSPDEQAALLSAVGVRSVDELFATVPRDVLQSFPLDLPPPASEIEVRRAMGQMAAKNANLSEWTSLLGGGLYAHYTTHIEHANFNVLLATFAIAYPIVGGLKNVFGTLVAVVFVQAFLIEGLRFLGDWRNLLFGALIVAAMNLRPQGFLGGRRA